MEIAMKLTIPTLATVLAVTLLSSSVAQAGCGYRVVSSETVVHKAFKEGKGIRFWDVDGHLMFKYDGMVSHIRTTSTKCSTRRTWYGKKTNLKRLTKEELSLISTIKFGR
jgi:hypothetical protein